MPVCEARYSDVSRRWTVALPFGVALEAATAFDVEMLVLKHAPGSAVRYVRDVLRGGADAQQPPGAGTGSTSEHITQPG